MKQKFLLLLLAAAMALTLLACGGETRAVEQCAQRYL